MSVTRHSPRARATVVGALAVVALATGCRNCDDLGNAVPNGDLDPRIFDFGPITKGTQCLATIQVTNVGGRVDLGVDGGVLKNASDSGTFTITKLPPSVRIGTSEDLVISYTAGDTVGEQEFVDVEVTTDDPRDDKKVLKGHVQAIVTDAPAPLATSACGEDDAQRPCTDVDFGAVQLNGTGLIIPVKIINDGTADMEVSAAVINNGNLDFSVESVRRGSTIVTLPTTVPPGRGGECGEATGEDNVLFVDVKYVPSALGADVDQLVVITDGVTGNVNVNLTGVGSDVGILITPDTINFGEPTEGQTVEREVNVSNVGTSSASVNLACIDLEDDDQCDAECDGVQTALNGTLSCAVTTVTGDPESKGFVLDPTDARPGEGDDERTITLTWTPAAGATDLPSTAVLALHSNILGDRVFTAPLLGGSVGVLEIRPDSAAETCPGNIADVCVLATGTPGNENFTTWAGTATVRLTNAGTASLTISDIALDGPATIVDDFTITDPASLTLAPGADITFTIAYDEVAPGADAAASAETCNIVVTHTGAGGSTIATLDVVPPT